jgi:glycosyltransferase involved in cell wall biosynthesis
LVVLLGRVGVSGSAMTRLFYLRNHTLGRRVARSFLDEVDVLYCFSGAALSAFRMADKRGVLCVLDRTTPTRPVRREILLEERETAPPEWQPRVDYDPRGQGIRGVLGAKRFDDVEAEEIERADTVICGSEFCADSVRRVGQPRGPIVVEPYGVDVSAFAPVERASRRGTLTLLLVGNIQAEKGVWYLLQAARRLQIPGLRVRLVGHLNLPGAALTPYEDLVTHVPHVPRIMVHQEYTHGDIYVLPTLYEGSSNTIYEAMASGLPVITTPNAGSIVRDGIEGFIVPVRDPDALAARVQQLHDDADLRREMGEAARQRALQFTWEDYGLRLSRVIRRVWEASGSRRLPHA